MTTGPTTQRARRISCDHGYLYGLGCPDCLKLIERDAARYRWMRENGAYPIEVTTQTGPNSQEHVGWLTTEHSVHNEPFPSMDAAIDAAMGVPSDMR